MMFTDASPRFPCSVCGQSVEACHGHPRRLFTAERIIHEVYRTTDEILRRTSDDGLLRTFAALTHRLHADRKREDLREQRNLVEAEILRRMT
jgi:hypothetical protein